MAYQAIFKRYEKKYMLTIEQRDKLLQVMKDHMKQDKFGNSTIRNLYFDTDNYLLIRRSLEKPSYKEKLRIRSYKKVDADGETFVEIKKKSDKVVYKRRISLPEAEAMNWIKEGGSCSKDCQIADEIEWFLIHYPNLEPKVFLSYDRQAFYSDEQKDFRITFDSNILARTTHLSLREDPFGESLLPKGYVLMELKCAGGYPMWMVKFLSENKIYKTSFSKYGTAYRTMIQPKLVQARKEKSVIYAFRKRLNNQRIPVFSQDAAMHHA